MKFKKSNQNTCINFTPIVKKNQKVKKNQLLCHGYGIHKENISLGKDILVAFMPFKGYNFEDAIIVSNNILKKDTFTSLHIEKLDIKIKNTIFGAEKITRNVFKKKNDKKNLDNNGIIKVGSNIKPGDILVGILTPKKNNNVYPENKLLNFIFNKKNNNIKDNSYKAPNNLYGKILKVKIIDNKTQINKNIKNKSIIYDKLFFKELYLLLIKYKKNIINKYLYNIILKYKENECVKKIKKNINYLKLLKITNKKKINILLYNKYIKFLYKKEHYNSLYKKNNNFNIDIIKIIKIYVIKKRILQIGDKMSGKHGNKGVISKIEEDFNMPFLKNGKSIDMVINPLGVPSRMNIGQILETLLGMVGKKSNKKFLIKPFNSINYMNLNKLIKKCNLPKFCKFNIYDGYTGEKMHQKVTVGYLHMLKLNHMVSDKIHVRSVGPYSLITQQPLGGRSQYGGQRFGEMEVWALEAYGAAYFLRELLTLKSDDIEGRLKTYHSIIEDKELPDPNVPESFNVLIKELNGLNIDILFKYD
ncbi:MAG: hypothetical protein ABNO52_00610 [Candidatus Shikimatogenerans sp. Tser]|uniref:DNA-directed RNA polymerase n=1 Tax=Candidatus Shikimatogenerans sp. Tser TaxID=3158568 RepID=A0AAU7QQS3_9FLAO